MLQVGSTRLVWFMSSSRFQKTQKVVMDQQPRHQQYQNACFQTCAFFPSSFSLTQISTFLILSLHPHCLKIQKMNLRSQNLEIFSVSAAEQIGNMTYCGISAIRKNNGQCNFHQLCRVVKFKDNTQHKRKPNIDAKYITFKIT